jgi:hypothetical protein
MSFFHMFFQQGNGCKCLVIVTTLNKTSKFSQLLEELQRFVTLKQEALELFVANHFRQVHTHKVLEVVGYQYCFALDLTNCTGQILAY